MAWGVPRFDYAVNYAGLSHVGRVRERNEDAWRVDMNLGLFALADGMGRHAAGEVAAAVCLDAFLHGCNAASAIAAWDTYLQEPTLDARAGVFRALVGAALQAHEAVLAEAQRDPSRRGMGCTLDAVLLLADRGFVVHVGDGRVYVTRPTATVQLTSDQTLGVSLAARGVDSPSNLVDQRTLTSAIGMEKRKPKIDEVFVELASVDRLLLCSDGVHGPHAETDLQKLARSGSAESTAYALVRAALDAGGDDNATVIVVDVNEKRLDRTRFDGGLAARDLAFASQCPLLQDLGEDVVAATLRTTVEEKFETGAHLPRFATNDRVAYVVLEGRVTTPDGWTLGPSALVYPESLVGAGRGPDLHVAQCPTRVLRLRRDDLRELCESDVAAAAALYCRLAHTLGGHT